MCFKLVKTTTYPASISKIRMPRAHQSTARPCPLLWMTSGARYSGVPQSVQVLDNGKGERERKRKGERAREAKRARES